MTTKLTKHMKDTIKDIVMEKAGLGYDSGKECAEKKGLGRKSAHIRLRRRKSR